MLLRIPLLLLCVLTMVGFISCGDDEVEEVHSPKITLGQAMAGTATIDFKYNVTDADKAVYKLLEKGIPQPSARELLNDAEATPLNLEATATTVTDLHPNTAYIIVAVAGNGSEYVSDVAITHITTMAGTEE